MVENDDQMNSDVRALENRYHEEENACAVSSINEKCSSLGEDQ